MAPISFTPQKWSRDQTHTFYCAYFSLNIRKEKNAFFFLLLLSLFFSNLFLQTLYFLFLYIVKIDKPETGKHFSQVCGSWKKKINPYFLFLFFNDSFSVWVSGCIFFFLFSIKSLRERERERDRQTDRETETETEREITE